MSFNFYVTLICDRAYNAFLFHLNKNADLLKYHLVFLLVFLILLFKYLHIYVCSINTRTVFCSSMFVGVGGRQQTGNTGSGVNLSRSRGPSSHGVKVRQVQVVHYFEENVSSDSLLTGQIKHHRGHLDNMNDS